MKINNPKNITIIFNDTFTLNGFKKGAYIEFDQSEDDYKKDVSGDGEVTIIAMVDKSGELTIGLKNNSSVAFSLYSLLNMQIADDEPIKINMIDDNINMSVSTMAFIKKMPKYSGGGDTIADEDFVFLCENVARVQGSTATRAILKAAEEVRYSLVKEANNVKRAVLEAANSIFKF